MRALAAIGLSLALVAGCASTSPEPAKASVSNDVYARTGHRVQWDQGSDEDARVGREIDALLSRDLSVDAAVQVALLGNGGLRAKLEELAIAQADLVQAGLLRNPVFSLGSAPWESEHLAPNLVASVEMDFLDVVTMPLRKRVAATELEATKLEVADQVLELAAQVREAYYSAQAAEQVLAMRRLVEEGAKASLELLQREHEAGNVSDLALSTDVSQAAQASVERARAEAEVATLREKLNKLMGNWGRRTSWRMIARLPELPPDEPSLDGMETAAVTQRLDIAAARRNVQAMDYALSQARTMRWTGTVNISVEAGRLRHNRRFAFGPTVALEIPLFDQRQAQIARLEAFKRQGERQLEALAVDVRADVRASYARVLAARAVLHEYASVVVPARGEIVRLSQERYDAMLLGVHHLIQARQSELDAYRETIEAARDYWIARSDLERAVGGRLIAIPSPRSPRKTP